MENYNTPFKITVVGKRKVKIIQVFGSTTLVEYVTDGTQSSVHSSLVKTITIGKKTKKSTALKIMLKMKKPQKRNNNNSNNQQSLDL